MTDGAPASPNTVAPQLVLAPATPRGWFGGRGLVAGGAWDVRAGVTLAEAADALEREFSGDGRGATAVLARYDGSCTVVRFADVRRVERASAASDTASADAAVPAGALPAAAPLLTAPEWDLAPRDYRAGVAAVRERIAAGDVYVLNLTARLEGELVADSPGDAFATLRRRAAADMAALLEGLPGETPWIASVSPERFVRVRREAAGADAPLVAEIEPIKGTRPRGATEREDAALAAELAADPKERAEHVMVVDMERNDLGVSCVPGSIHVEPLYEVVTTPYCHQLVSTVRGTLEPGASFGDLLAATFPCGSVTGAPKRAAMRIIEQLEATPRGAYCGALLVAMPGELDSAVLIRTLEGVGESPDRARWGAGAGLTHDSDPAGEYLETLLKASPVTGDGVPPDALRETMRVVDRSAPLFARHQARLAAGGCGPSLLARVHAEVASVLGGEDAKREPARLGVTVTPDGEVTVGVTHEASSLAIADGPRLAPVLVRATPVLPPAAAKPASRAYWDRAHRAARLAGADQAVLHTPDGSLIDGSTATVWLVLEGALATPPAPPAVGGVCRELVFDAAAQFGLVAEVRTLSLADLAAADEVWLSNAYGGFVPVRGRGGPVGERIAEAVEAAFAAPDS